jgi:hypothetical protein
MADHAPELKTILAKDAAGNFRLWACRGEGKGCARNQFRERQKPCDDCMGPLDENLTLGEVMDKLKQGDA